MVYVSGEEAIAQVRLRAERLGLDDAAVLLATETNVSDILATLEEGRPPVGGGHRFDPDPVVAGDRIGTRHRFAAQGRRPRR